MNEYRYTYRECSELRRRRRNFRVIGVTVLTVVFGALLAFALLP